MIRATILAFLMWWLLKTYSVRTYQFFSKVVFEAVFGDFEVFGESSKSASRRLRPDASTSPERGRGARD